MERATHVLPEPPPTPITGLSTNYRETLRLIFSLDPVIQRPYNGNLMGSCLPENNGAYQERPLSP